MWKSCEGLGFLSSCFYIEDMEVDFVISLDIVKEEFWKMDLLIGRKKIHL